MNSTLDDPALITKALLSWIRHSPLPQVERLALEHNVVRDIAARNRLSAELRGIGYDSRIVSRPPPSREDFFCEYLLRKQSYHQEVYY
ncbi:MAG: hypothetical protein M3239_00445, partial [Thermoproteota archaeon]|nr:hypothetical protein [Thermoproteota archaeon]